MNRNRPLGPATIAILKAVREGHRFGLDMMDATGLPSGTVYPTLTRLERRKYVKGNWEAAAMAKREGRPRRRYYELTPDGKGALEHALASIGALISRPQTNQQ